MRTRRKGGPAVQGSEALQEAWGPERGARRCPAGRRVGWHWGSQERATRGGAGQGEGSIFTRQALPRLGWGGGATGPLLSPGPCLPTGSAPAPGLGFLQGASSCSRGPPRVVRSAERQGRSSGRSSALDTRWLRGSSRFSETSSWLPLLPLVGSLCPSSVGPKGRLAGGWPRHRGPAQPPDRCSRSSFEARREAAAGGPLLLLWSSCAPSENPLNKEKSHKHKYCLFFEGFRRSYSPRHGASGVPAPVASFQLSGTVAG